MVASNYSFSLRHLVFKILHIPIVEYLLSYGVCSYIIFESLQELPFKFQHTETGGEKKPKYSEIEVMVGVCGSQGSQFWAHANALSACAFGSIVWNLM